MGYYRDLREYVGALEHHGKLFHITRAINRETELHPLVRWQFRGLREEERGAFLFDNVTSVTGRRYNMRVLVGACASSTAIYALGMACNENEILSRWLTAQREPIAPVTVPSGPVQEIEVTQNIYSGYMQKGGRIGVGLGAGKDSRLHLDKCRELGIPLKAAAVIGPTPNLIYAAAATLPYGTDEYAIAGGIAGEPLELVRCKTSNLLVPAHAEMILEGEILPDDLLQSWPFGEYSGYMAGKSRYPRFRVHRITHRPNPILLDLLAEHAPSEGSKQKQIATEATFFHFLKENAGLSGVKQVAIHEESGGWGFFVIQMKVPHPTQAWQALYAAAAFTPGLGKFFVVVDDDIDPRDLDAVVWALVFRAQPHRDIIILPGKRPMLDPSAVSPADPGWHHAFPSPNGASCLLINAVRKWPYPPVALPAKKFMERARQIWEEEKLPILKPKTPWHGYELGQWPDEFRKAAEAMIAGRDPEEVQKDGNK
jgi:4-hydroxy-3-polyprenylbenzoate decarboxylase